MSSPTNPGLPDPVGQFAHEPSGLIVFAGAPGSGRTTSARALAAHVEAVTGRAVADFGQHTAGRTAATAFLADGAMTTDRLAAMVDAAANGGALVIATMESGPHPYPRLLDLVQAAEGWDGELRRDFDAALYAVVHHELVDGAPVAEVHTFSGRR